MSVTVMLSNNRLLGGLLIILMTHSAHADSYEYLDKLNILKKSLKDENHALSFFAFKEKSNNAETFECIRSLVLVHYSGSPSFIVEDYFPLKQGICQRFTASQSDRCGQLPHGSVGHRACVNEEVPAEQEVYRLLTQDERCQQAKGKALQNLDKLEVMQEKLLSKKLVLPKVLWGLAGASVASAIALGIASRIPQGCYNSENLPRLSDGKEAVCVYPLNYQVGVPALVGIGAAFALGGGYTYYKGRTESAEVKNRLKHIEDVRMNLAAWQCPPPLPLEPASGLGDAGKKED